MPTKLWRPRWKRSRTVCISWSSMSRNSVLSMPRCFSSRTARLLSSAWSCLLEVNTMLRREEAEKRLQKFQIKNWEKQRISELGRLPKKLCAIGRGLFYRDPKGKSISDWDKRRQAQEAAQGQLAELSPGERQKIFAVLFPKLARRLEDAWQLVARLPYEVDYERKGFRAPNDPAVQQTARAGWLDQLVDELKGYDPDIAWVAAWAPHLGYGGADAVGILLAAAIDSGGKEGDEVFRILCES